MKKATNIIVEFNALEVAAAYNALARYIDMLEAHKAKSSCIDAMLEGEIDVSKRAKSKFYDAFTKAGYEASLLEQA